MIHIKKFKSKSVLKDKVLLEQLKNLEESGFVDTNGFENLLEKCDLIYIAFAYNDIVAGYFVIHYDEFNIEGEEPRMGLFFARGQVSQLYHSHGVASKMLQKILEDAQIIQHEYSSPIFGWALVLNPFAHQVAYSVWGKNLQPYICDLGNVIFDKDAQKIGKAISAKLIPFNASHASSNNEYPFILRNFSGGSMRPTQMEQARIENLIKMLPLNNIFKHFNLNAQKGDALACVVPQILKSKL